ncbi:MULTISPECIES: PTS sugar transporter subunit IIA [unclassified Enterococcus]|uniref:PTS sugar transporter subunit IIA n=1 Tax=unclassified Enterococcus TaxID=2608891 RepID=UPI00155642FE|nr:MULTISPECIES: PTS sugar transporter subunit IIA [unclassified Enterococcus]MBS7578172.1 PTS sugar transporter subunit IIA [Enterococcus sp. MMGLQ5-2]MBS7584012.1 PTS sugar transporter subunit IIA [Enterococcus sp. MMGLQ5-1]NPD11873.1 PTS sugar transporter subunit IIA [Enterococcus sp. MMGLQ5-1]NPD38003.1 PTS sugar transporter subunit IIA [Enterococcus sp. MMGLQ5-2]
MSISENFLNEQFIHFVPSIDSWEQAIEKVAKPLLEAEIIEARYVDAMIRIVAEMGSYIVIVPKVAMPHARPEDGALGIGISILKIAQPVCFDSNKKVNIIICLATDDNQRHLSLLQEVSLLFDDDSKVDSLIATNNVIDFVKLAQKYVEEGLEEI